MSEQVEMVEAEPVDARVASAMSIVKNNMLWSAGAGVIPLPFVELAAITAVQVKLINELGALYGHSIRGDLARSAVVSLVGGLGSVALGKMLALSGLRAIPLVGPIIGVAAVPGAAAAITYATGKVFILHFEAGGTLLDFDAAKMREYFREQFTAGLKEAASAAAPASKPAAAAA